MIIGYTRVSTRGQIDGNSFEQQEKEIFERYPSAQIFKEQFTGTTTRRPIFEKVIDKLVNGDTLVVTKLDRFCRSTKEGLEIIETLQGKGVRIHILNMGLIEDTPMGRLIVTNLLAFAEFERNMIVERTQSGKAIAKTKAGFKEGRPKKYTATQINMALDLLKEHSYTEVERMTRISKSTLTREMRRRKRDKGLL